MIITGDIEVILYENEENGYRVLMLDVGGEPITVTGTFPAVVEGQTLELEGDFSVHKKYGRQFKARKATLKKATSVDGIVRYLGSGLIKGIGPALALRIASYFGEKTFDIIEFAPQRLAEVKGISKLKAEEISKAYNEIKDMQQAVMALQSYDIPLGTALKIYKTYGNDTEKIVTNNPYRLIEDIDGIGFLTADKIAVKTGIARDSEYRVAAGVIHILKEGVVKGGNTCYPFEKTVQEATELLKVSSSLTEDIAIKLLTERRLISYETGGVELISLPSVYHIEKNAAVLLNRMMINADKSIFSVADDIDYYEKINGISLHETQREAVTAAVENGVTLITGGPGTGKTTIIKCIIELFEKFRKKVILMAPTGRAAKRMNEATGREASTIHRACKLGHDAGSSGEKLICDVVIVDEFSMVDIFLLEALLKKIPTGAKIVLVGDKDQLPSVGAGNVLADIIRSEVIKTVQLTHVYRQAEESLIVTNAHAVNRGEMPVLTDKTRDFFYTSAVEPEAVASLTVDMVERAAKYIGVEPDKVQVLCPMKNGAAGAININRRLQAKLNPPVSSERVETEDYDYRVGDKVMHVVNNYDLEWKIFSGYNCVQGVGVFNGDIGIVTEIRQSEMTVTFEDGRQAVYTPDLYSQLVLAYSITVHKSQGSEFDAVILPIVGGGPMIMTRNLLYTAITRAKKMVVLIGERYKIKAMVDNSFVAARYSLFKDLLLKARKDENALFGVE